MGQQPHTRSFFLSGTITRSALGSRGAQRGVYLISNSPDTSTAG